MPYIGLKVSCNVDSKQEAELKASLGRAIENIPGKNENWLMVCIEDNQKLYFRGDNYAPSAYAEVKIFGSSEGKAYEDMTAALCRIFEEVLGVPPDRTYVKYEECSIWGWNGANF